MKLLFTLIQNCIELKKLIDNGEEKLQELVKTLDADGLIVHINPYREIGFMGE